MKSLELPLPKALQPGNNATENSTQKRSSLRGADQALSSWLDTIAGSNDVAYSYGICELSAG